MQKKAHIALQRLLVGIYIYILKVILMGSNKGGNKEHLGLP